MTTSGSGEKLGREESGLRPAVTAKNYMPCAKVLPLHYSNIKSTRVAVFAIFLRLPPQRRRILLQGISAQSDKVRSVVQNFFRDSRPAHMVPTRRQPHRHSTTRGRQSVLGVHSWRRIREGLGLACWNYTLHFNHNSNQRNLRHYSGQQALQFACESLSRAINPWRFLHIRVKERS